MKRELSGLSHRHMCDKRIPLYYRIQLKRTGRTERNRKAPKVESSVVQLGVVAANSLVAVHDDFLNMVSLHSSALRPTRNAIRNNGIPVDFFPHKHMHWDEIAGPILANLSTADIGRWRQHVVRHQRHREEMARPARFHCREARHVNRCVVKR